MAARRKTIKSNRIKLTAEDIAVAAPRMMATAQARQRASGWCDQRRLEMPACCPR